MAGYAFDSYFDPGRVPVFHYQLSDYESGFQPAYSGYVVNEMSDMSRFLPFGDTNEALLSTALGAIDGSIQPPAQEDTRSLRVTTLANSIERRASHAVRIK